MEGGGGNKKEGRSEFWWSADELGIGCVYMIVMSMMYTDTAWRMNGREFQGRQNGLPC